MPGRCRWRSAGRRRGRPRGHPARHRARSGRRSGISARWRVSRRGRHHNGPAARLSAAWQARSAMSMKLRRAPASAGRYPAVRILPLIPPRPWGSRGGTSPAGRDSPAADEPEETPSDGCTACATRCGGDRRRAAGRRGGRRHRRRHEAVRRRHRGRRDLPDRPRRARSWASSARPGPARRPRSVCSPVRWRPTTARSACSARTRGPSGGRPANGSATCRSSSRCTRT